MTPFTVRLARRAMAAEAFTFLLSACGGDSTEALVRDYDGVLGKDNKPTIFPGRAAAPQRQKSKVPTVGPPSASALRDLPLPPLHRANGCRATSGRCRYPTRPRRGPSPPSPGTTP